MNPIEIQNGIGSVMGPGKSSRPNEMGETGSFGDMFKDAINSVNRQQKVADQAIEDLTTGKNADIHRTMIEMEKASVSFQLVMQVRNKLISAYEEIMRIQV